MKGLFSLLAIFMVLTAGCAQKKVVMSPETQKPGAASEQPQTKVEESKKAPEKIIEQKAAKIEARDMPSKGGEISEFSAHILFDFDKYDIRVDAKPVLKFVADYLMKNYSHKVLIEGYCDDRGTNEYNLGLGDRRAKATKDYLLSLGIRSARIETISYGEEKPLCKEQSEECRAKNRRADFIMKNGRI